MKNAKKLLVLLMTAALVLALAACGGGASSAAPAASEAAAESTAPAEAGSDAGSTAPAGGLRAALVLDGPIDDGGWNADCYSGMEQARDELGFEITVSENLAAADFVSAFREYAAEGYDLIVAPGNQFQDAVEQIYEEFPDSHFAGINFTLTADNVTSMSFNNVQAGFLAGAFAGLFTQTDSAGYIGGTEIQPTTDSMRGMEQGLAYVNEAAQFTSSMTGSWDDVAKGKELGTSQITTANVDVIFSFAGACNTGIVEAAKEKGTWVIVEPMDILETDPDAICGSVLMSNGALIMFAANLVVDGEPGQAMVGDIANGVVGFGTFNDAVSEDIVKELGQICQDIVDGTITME